MNIQIVSVGDYSMEFEEKMKESILENFPEVSFNPTINLNKEFLNLEEEKQTEDLVQ